MTALVAEAAVGALAEHPALNGWIADDELTTFAEVHLGVAVDTTPGSSSRSCATRTCSTRAALRRRDREPSPSARGRSS